MDISLQTKILESALYNVSYKRGQKLARKELKTGTIQPTEDHQQAQREAEVAWIESNNHKLDVQDLMDKIERFRGESDWAHLYTEIRVGFENGYADFLTQ